MYSLAKHEHFKLNFQALQVNWTGMTNVLDGPGLKYVHIIIFDCDSINS